MKNIQLELIEYVKNHQIDEIKQILNKKPRVDLLFTDLNGNTLLHHAASHISQKGLPLLQILLEKKIDPLSLNENFESAMDTAKKINNIPALTLMKHYALKNKKELESYL